MVDEFGNLVFSGLPPGDYTLTQQQPSGTDGLWVYCSRDWNPDDRLATQTDIGFPGIYPAFGFATKLLLEPGANILCDVYAVPRSAAA